MQAALEGGRDEDVAHARDLAGFLNGEALAVPLGLHFVERRDEEEFLAFPRVRDEHEDAILLVDAGQVIEMAVRFERVFLILAFDLGIAGEDEGEAPFFHPVEQPFPAGLVFKLVHVIYTPRAR